MILSLLITINRFQLEIKITMELRTGTAPRSIKELGLYNSCRHSNLNGMYYDGGAFQLEDGVTWYHWKRHKYSLKRTEMKIRPVDF